MTTEGFRRCAASGNRRLPHSAASFCAALIRVFTTTLIASSMRSRAYFSAVGRSSRAKVCVWILRASQRFCAMSPAPPLAADAVDIDVVAHQMGDIHEDGLVRKRGEAELAAAAEHARGVVDRLGSAGAFEYVIEPAATRDPAHGLDRVLPANVDGVVGAELATDLQAIVAGPGQDHRSSTQCLGDRDPEQPDRPGAEDRDAFAGDEPAELGQPVHRGAGGHDEARLLVRDAVRDGDQRVDVVDLIFAEPAVGGEAVGAVALVAVAVVEPVIEAGGVHAFAAALRSEEHTSELP